MIYGYDSRTLNEYGLKEMREITFDVLPDDLRALAEFLAIAADEIERGDFRQTHKHVPDSLQHRIGCDVIVSGTIELDDLPLADE